MDPTQILLFGVLVPATVAGLVWGLSWKIWRKDDAEANGRWSGSLAVGAAFALGFLLMLGSPASFLPDSERTPTGLDWVLWCSLPATLLVPLFARPGWVFPLLRLALGAALIRLVLKSQFEMNWTEGEGLPWLGGLCALFYLQWTAFERLASPRSKIFSPVVLWFLAAGLATLAGLTGSAKIGQLGGTLAAAMGAAVVIRWRVPRLDLSGGAAAMTVVLLFALGLNAYFYSYTPGLDILLAASAPLLALGPVVAFRDWSTTRRTLVSLLLAALPLGIAIARAVVEMLQETEEYPYY